MGYLIALVLVVMIAPLFAIYRKKASGKKLRSALIIQAAAFFAVCVLICGLGIGSVLASSGTESAASETSGVGASQTGLGMLAAALSTGLSCLGAGFAVAASSSAAIGAISENDQTFGKAIIFVALAEGVALYGFLISFLILGKF